MITLLLCSLVLTACTNKNLAINEQPSNVSLWLETCEDWDMWDKPGPPFRIYGNSYYVGTCGISALLITGDQGHILIDSGTKMGAQIVASNILQLGFSLQDIKLILHSHEHYDHVGGLANLQKRSGAQVLASPAAAPVLNSGTLSTEDPQYGVSDGFSPASVNGLVTDGQVVKLGSLALIPITTPGHTPGALSWQWQSCQNHRCLSLVYADSLSPVSADGYFFSDHPDYLNAYRDSLKKLKKLDCDIVLAPHPSASKIRSRLASPDGLIDTDGCEKYAQNVLDRLNKRLIKEQEKKQ